MKAVGTGVDKANLDVVVHGESAVQRFANSRAGIAKLVKRLQVWADGKIVLEATGGFEEALLAACCDAGLWVCRINPRQARDFKTVAISATEADDKSIRAVIRGRAHELPVAFLVVTDQ